MSDITMVRTGAATFLTALLLAAAPAPVSAQDAGPVGATPTVDSITVTAQKREESSLDVPINLTALSGDFLEEFNIDDAEELSRFVPGLNVQEQSPNNPGFVIRGITSDSGEANIEPRVSIFQNGVPISRSRGSITELYDLERVEVLKGPQGTLFGRSAQIGAVSIVTNKPSYELEAEAYAAWGSFQYQRHGGFVNVPLVDETLAVRVAGQYRASEGYITSLNPNQEDFNGTEVAALRGSVRFDATPDLRFDLIAEYEHNTPSGTSFKSGVIPALGGNTDPNEPAFLNDFGDFPGSDQLRIDREVWGVTLLGDWILNDVFGLASTTAYRTFDSFELFDPDGSAFDILIVGEDAHSEQWSQELRLDFDTGRLRGFVGGNYFWEDGSQGVPLGYSEQQLSALFGTLAATAPTGTGDLFYGGDPILLPFVLSGDPAALGSILPLTPLGGLDPFVLEQFTNFGETTSWDVFGEVTFDVTDRLSLTGGLRYTTEDKRTGFSGGVVDGPALQVLGGLIGAGIDPFLPPGSPGALPLLPNGLPAVPTTLLVPDTLNQVVYSDERTFDDFVWRLVANYAATDNVNLFASYARGRRPEVIAPDADGGQFNGYTVVDAEIVDSYEVGAKARLFGGAMTAEGSVFYYDYTNFQTTIIEPATGRTETINAGTASSVGVEAQVFANPVEGLELFATYGFNRGRFDDTDEDGNPLLFGGNQFRLAPDHAFALGGRYGHEVKNLGTVYLEAAYTWQSKVYFDEDNLDARDVIDPASGAVLWTVPAEAQDAYGLLSADAGVEMFDGGLVFEIFTENLLDEDFIIDAGNTGGAFGTPTYIGGKPRTVGARINVRY